MFDYLQQLWVFLAHNLVEPGSGIPACRNCSKSLPASTAWRWRMSPTNKTMSCGPIFCWNSRTCLVEARKRSVQPIEMLCGRIASDLFLAASREESL
jgi:hypothetical protein